MSDGRQKIALIDGEPVVRTVVAAILENAGYAVSATDDINVVLQMCAENVPDLVLTNVFLPGISGHDAMRLIKEKCVNVRVLMVSGLPSSSTIQEWMNEDGFDVFPKPFTASALVSKVREALTLA